jgi:nitroreductase
MVDILLKRRSCRQFERDSPLPKSDIETIINAGRAYPCAMGNQELEFVVITNRALLDRLGAAVAEACPPVQGYLKKRQADYGVTELVWCDAPLVIFLNFKNPPTPPYSEVNGGTAVFNLIAAAEELGYGTLPVQMASIAPQNAAVAEILGIPANQVGISVGIGKVVASWKPEEKGVIPQVKWIE